MIITSFFNSIIGCKTKIARLNTHSKCFNIILNSRKPATSLQFVVPEKHFHEICVLTKMEQKVIHSQSSVLRRKHVYSLSAILFSIILIFSSCVKETFDMSKLDKTLNLSSGVALPIGNLHLGYDPAFNDIVSGVYTISDTLTFDWLKNSLPASDKIERLIFRVNTINAYPASFASQVYILDQNKLVTDSLFSPVYVIQIATDQNGDGIIDPVNQGPEDVELTRSQINHLTHSGYIVVYSRAVTTNFKVTDVSAYYLDFNLGTIFQLKINSGN
jgi:hypothetical protein